MGEPPLRLSCGSNWKQSVQVGELWIIFLALRMVERKANVRIFSDNQNATTAINKLYTKGKHGGIVAMIIREIEERQKEGAITQVLHVNSHLRDGKKKQEVVQKQEKEMRRRYGEELEYIIHGNHIADQLTQTAREEELISQKRWHQREWSFYWEGEYVSKKEFTRILTKIWMTTRNTYEELLTTTDYSKKRTRQWMAEAKGKTREQVRLCQQINIGKLPTRKRLNNKMEEGQIDLPMVYLYKHCPFHPEQVEDENHFIQCLETRKSCKNLPREVIKHINKAITHANEQKEVKKQKISWFPPIYGKLEEEDKNANWEIWKGFVPNKLEKELTELIEDKQKEKETINKIMASITKFTKKRWKIRCKKLFQEDS